MAERQNSPTRRDNVAVIIDSATYVNGYRIPGEPTPAAAARSLAQHPDGFAWIGLHDPTRDEIDALADALALPAAAVSDAREPHQRPKLEQYEDTTLLVVKTADYDEPLSEVITGEIAILISTRYIAVLRHGVPNSLVSVRSKLERRPDDLAEGPAAVLHEILDAIVDGYIPVLDAIDDDIDEVEELVLNPRHQVTASSTNRIYYLKREVLDLTRALGSLVAPIDRLADGDLACVQGEVRRHFRAVHEQVLRVREHAMNQRELLTSILDANLSQVSIRQNEDMRKMSAWAAMIAVPTLIAGVYGMNFQHMPELDSRVGYPLTLGGMALISGLLYAFFKRRQWL